MEIEWLAAVQLVQWWREVQLAQRMAWSEMDHEGKVSVFNSCILVLFFCSFGLFGFFWGGVSGFFFFFVNGNIAFCISVVYNPRCAEFVS